MLKVAKECGTNCTSVESLVAEITRKLLCPVSTREPSVLRDVSKKNDGTATPVGEKSIDLETAFSIELDHLFEILSAKSSIYHMLSNEKRAEWAIFLMALFTFKPFLSSLPLNVRDSLTHIMPAELVSSKVEVQVTGIRRQMMGLNTCLCEESR